MKARVSGQLASVVDKVAKTSGKPYRALQIAQKTKTGALFLVNARVYDSARVLKVGENIEIEGVVSVFKFSDGTPGMSFDVYGDAK